MKLNELRKETYYHYSKKAADIARQLALIGIAAAWIFRIQQKDGSIEVPNRLVYSIIFLASGVAFDFFRYAFQTAFWGIYCWQKEQKGQQEFDSHPQWVNWIPNILLWLGFASILVGYLYLIKHLFCVLC